MEALRWLGEDILKCFKSYEKYLGQRNIPLVSLDEIKLYKVWTLPLVTLCALQHMSPREN